MHRTTLFTLLMTTIVISRTSGQTGLPDDHDTRYYAAVRDFVSSAIHSREDSSTQFILQDSVSTSHAFDFLQECLSDTATFTSDERQQIQAWAAHPPFKIWTADLVPDAHLIPKDTIKSVFSKEQEDGWSYFYSHFGRNFNTIGCPLFLRNYTWCIFYSGNHCGWLCGGGQLALYKKEGSRWVFIKNWGTWIS